MSATSILNRIENTFEGWLKPLPHLPENGRKWIANNVWWIVLVGLIISVFATFSLISAILAAIGLMGTMSSYLAAYGVTVYTPMYIASTVVALASMVIAVVLTAMAISPLKSMKAKGWNLLFATSLISLTLSVISYIIDFNLANFIPSIIGAALGLAIGMYFLFEIRTYFKDGSKAVKSSDTTKA